MDYSLLLAIETIQMENRHESQSAIHQIRAPRLSGFRKKGGYEEEVEFMDVGELMSRKHCFINEHLIYHIAIIDYLQDWSFKKKGERFIKTNLLGKDPDNLSAIEPNAYA